MKDKLVSKEMIRGMHPIFRGRLGDAFIKILSAFSGINKLNAVYDASKHLTGLDFVNDMIGKLGITCRYKNRETLELLKGKSFITVSNHPYGHLDGIIEIGAIGAVRNDFKMMVNWVLMQIDTMDEFFIGVNPFPKNNKMSTVKSSVGGIKQCLDHLRNGHPLGFFPSGGISLPHLKGGPEDAEWKESVLKIIKKAKVPIVPVYISGGNSWFYQLLGFIGWRVRTVRLLHEITNKKGKTISVNFGTPVSVEQQNEYENIREFGRFLKSKVYEMRKNQDFINLNIL